MNSTELTTNASQTAAGELEQTLEDLMRGIRRPEKIKAACERMDHLREENFRLFGEQNLAVELVRQTRNRSRAIAGD